MSHESGTDLPAVPSPVEIEPEIVDGQVVDDEMPATAPATLNVVQVVRVTIVNPVRMIVCHEHTRAAGRQFGYVPLGTAVVARRLWESRTTSRYERWLRMAEATGNMDQILELEERLSEFRTERHARRMDLLEYPLKVAVMLPKALLGVFLALACSGVLLAIATKHIAEVAVPFKVTAAVFMWVAIAVSVAYGPVLLSLPWLGIGALWWTGRNAAGSGPMWTRTAADPDTDMAIDETTIAKALDSLRIPQIRDYLKGGMPLQYITPCRRDGRGSHAVIRLPAGVTAERIARRRADLATGLYRLAKEVWPSTGAEAGILDLWVADKGALAEGAGPYPLLDEGTTDVFRGVPFGRTLRGDPIAAPLMERNTIAGGMPGQGKSSAARIIMAGAVLDPYAELRIWVPDTNFDFECFKRRCSRYEMGADDATIRRIRDDLAELRDEVQTRGQLLIDHQVPAVTPELGRAGVGLHSLFCMLEEAHIAIQHAVYGKEIAALIVEIVKLGRKRGIHLIVSTQAPTKDSMPRDVTRNCSNGIAFAVGDHVANDALLGQGAYAAGHRATELIPGTDRGTALVKGFSGERSDMVQVYFLDIAATNDQVTPIISRSLAELRRLGLPVPGTTRTRKPIETRDLLDDLAAVLGTDRARLADVPALLREHAPTWGPYRTLTGVQLRDLLDDTDVRWTNVGNVPRLDPADLRRAIAERTAGADVS
jgi:DNA segregation ATPase FtsK/SpoIIIE, S-DNA-T family